MKNQTRKWIVATVTSKVTGVSDTRNYLINESMIAQAKRHVGDNEAKIAHYIAFWIFVGEDTDYFEVSNARIEER